MATFTGLTIESKVKLALQRADDDDGLSLMDLRFCGGSLYASFYGFCASIFAPKYVGSYPR